MLMKMFHLIQEASSVPTSWRGVAGLHTLCGSVPTESLRVVHVGRRLGEDTPTQSLKALNVSQQTETGTVICFEGEFDTYCSFVFFGLSPRLLSPKLSVVVSDSGEVRAGVSENTLLPVT